MCTDRPARSPCQGLLLGDLKFCELDRAIHAPILQLQGPALVDDGVELVREAHHPGLQVPMHLVEALIGAVRLKLHATGREGVEGSARRARGERMEVRSMSTSKKGDRRHERQASCVPRSRTVRETRTVRGTPTKSQGSEWCLRGAAAHARCQPRAAAARGHAWCERDLHRLMQVRRGCARVVLSEKGSRRWESGWTGTSAAGGGKKVSANESYAI